MRCALVFLGIEARGFIFGPPIALAIGAKFVPLRKPRKLPGIFHSFIYLLITMLIHHHIYHMSSVLHGMEHPAIELTCFLFALNNAATRNHSDRLFLCFNGYNSSFVC